MPGLQTSVERGRFLEECIASYFGAHGYAVRTNVVLEGRSGGRHEIDVLAEKSDPLTTIRIAVECKAWAQPIEKDVVSKLSYLLSDLGLNKGIVVSLKGSRSGAGIAAGELGIDLWGPAELERHLGTAGFGTLQAGPASQLADGYPFATRIEVAEAIVRRQAKGRLGIRLVEEVVWLEPAYLPVYAVDLSVTQTRVRRRREHLTTATFENMYEAVSGRFLGPPPAKAPVEVDVGDIGVPPAVRDTSVVGDIRKAVDRYRAVSQATAVERHAAVLAELGIPTPCEAVGVERVQMRFVPAYLGVLRQGDRDRVVAVDGRRGRVHALWSSVLTSNLRHLRQSLDVD